MEKQKVYSVVEEISCHSCERTYITPTKEALLALKEKTPVYCKSCKNKVDVFAMYVPIEKSLIDSVTLHKITHCDYIAKQLEEKTEKDIVCVEIDCYPKYVRLNL